MRTPGDDHALALGFLRSEGIISSADDVGTIAHCGRPGDEGYGNTIDVTPAPGTVWDLAATGAARRGTLITSACGVCGRRSVRDLVARLGGLPPGAAVAPAVVARLPEALRQGQRTFARTGGVHAAAACTADGVVMALAEDVGRHNAVDKVVGRLMSSSHREPPRVLVVSGRVSFEIVQKAAAGRIPAVVAVSAPTTLAIDLAAALDIGLAAFVRGDAFNIYAHPGRFDG
jgi:FdhD protein